MGTGNFLYLPRSIITGEYIEKLLVWMHIQIYEHNDTHINTRARDLLSLPPFFKVSEENVASIFFVEEKQRKKQP
jgi:hypothetical protein